MWRTVLALVLISCASDPVAVNDLQGQHFADTGALMEVLDCGPVLAVFDLGPVVSQELATFTANECLELEGYEQIVTRSVAAGDVWLMVNRAGVVVGGVAKHGGLAFCTELVP